MNLINFFSNSSISFNIEQRLLQKLSYFNVSQYIQELMFLGFEHSFYSPTILNLESTKGFFYTAPLYRLNKLLKTTYLIKDFSVKKKDKKLFFNSHAFLLNFINTFKLINPFSSSLHLMSDTGAKANWNQICQLIGLRGYLSNSTGHSFKIPILNSFNKGLKFYEYFISCCGARKGILDTAIKTSSSGYLTRRLVESTQEIVVKEYDCGTTNYIKYNSLLNTKGYLKTPLFLLYYGKLLTHNIVDLSTQKVLEFKHKYITTQIIEKLEKKSKQTNISFNLKSVKTCFLHKYICSKCFGFSTFKQNHLGKNIGVLSGQAVGEPGTQLVLRTFHTGGAINTIYNKNKYLNYNVQESIFKQKKFKVCSFNNFKYIKDYYKYISFILNITTIKKKRSFLLKKNKSIYLMLQNKKIIYQRNIFDFLNSILFNSSVHKIYQRTTKSSYIVQFNYTGEININKNLFIVLKNLTNKWVLVNLNKSVLFKRYFNVYHLSNNHYITYKISKNNRNLKIHILINNFISLFNYKYLKNNINTTYYINLYNIYFYSNIYGNIERNKNSIYIKQYKLFNSDISKLNYFCFI